MAVTTTTTGRASTRIITNYNGAAYIGTNHGYDTIRPKDSALEPLLWQAGRATSAAPGLDGELTWRSLLCSLGKKALDRYFRLNIEFAGPEPRLDDISAIDDLSRHVTATKDDAQLNKVKLALLASSFFFELRRAPKFDSCGFYVCQGEIRLRGDHMKILMGLRSIDKTGSIGFWNDQQSLGCMDFETDKCYVCNKFCKKVCFFVRHPTEKVSIALALGERRRQISGFPQTVAWFSTQQHLDTPFYDEEVADTLAWSCECRKRDDRPVSVLVKRRPSNTSLTSGTAKRVKRGTSSKGTSS
ncbi:hypothetical protein LTR78_010466 [Recurvomyces mirabilis]|uniref:Uncharacterized protein n=1 Tax=Recurvomyces mirabilis TaxID=574656 RepID=A0AAE0TN13_9PEZI|nr:hypothetical protein LTR78_010466 [Recurvomyces mirabilis]KAK5150359.1 hypothetical protein LTS14_010198 [Recurvomyces mirabilis]